MELALFFESRDDANPTADVLSQILGDANELLTVLQSQGFPVASVTIAPPAEFPKGAKKLAAKFLIVFLSGVAVEGGKEAGKQVGQEVGKDTAQVIHVLVKHLEKKYPDVKFDPVQPAKLPTPHE